MPKNAKPWIVIIPTSIKAITAIKNDTASSPVMFNNPTTKPNTNKMIASHGIAKNPAKIAKIMPIIKAHLPVLFIKTPSCPP